GSSLKACCPFHNEKTPSFMVNREKQVFYCFGCGAGGTIFDFVMRREGLEFGEALKLLAERAGVKLETHDPRLEGEKTRLLAVLDLAARFFRHQLTTAASGAVARTYVASRSIGDAASERFQLGYAPDSWDALNAVLVQRGFTPQEAVGAGLAIPSREDRQLTPHASRLTPRVYDRFRHRLMFPIHDAMGRVVGFTGRILEGGTTVGKSGETPAKYVNTPETALYKKGALVYGLWHAKEAIRSAGYAVLVEGNTDVVACHEFGIAQAIATSGTAFTSEQLKLLKRYTSSLRVAFDADPAGEGAAERGIDAALDAGFDVSVIRMPTDDTGKPIAKDADECVRKDVEAWRRAVANPIPVFDFFLERIRAQFDLRLPAGQRDAGRVIVAHLRHVVDPIERAAWVRRCAEAIGVPERAVTEAVRFEREHSGRTPIANIESTAMAATVHDHPTDLVERLLALLSRFPDLRPSADSFQIVTFLPEPYRSLYTKSDTSYIENDPVNEPNFSPAVLAAIEQRIEFLGDREFAEWSEEQAAAELRQIGRSLIELNVRRGLATISRRLTEIDRMGDHSEAVQSERDELIRKSDELNRARSAF
ncbi:MAG: DNA primase, partial [Candidatus Uhrbacteria bacterium]